MKSLYDHIMKFNHELDFRRPLPKGIRVMNPFRENHDVLKTVDRFYKKFYSDSHTRRLILGINPGRLGAGSTGIPFTDTKRLSDHCGISLEGINTHEPSSVFIYQMIDAYGGTSRFYHDFLISSICPLGFVERKNGKWVNHNYYDSKKLEGAVRPFAVETLKKLTATGIDMNTVFVLGTGKNYAFIKEINDQYHFFKQVIPLEHPRYIMQYKSSQINEYIDKYLRALTLSPEDKEQ